MPCEGTMEVVKKTMSIRTYSELLRYDSFESRYDYLRLGGSVGDTTFGHSRFLNQGFYNSRLWRSIRREVILRDDGCDLGIEGRAIFGRVTIHHLNPITEEDLDNITDFLVNPEFLICVSRDTHNAIHYGDASLLPQLPIERTPQDTSPWLR
jgi:hypothetical protein